MSCLCQSRASPSSARASPRALKMPQRQPLRRRRKPAKSPPRPPSLVGPSPRMQQAMVKKRQLRIPKADLVRTMLLATRELLGACPRRKPTLWPLQATLPTSCPTVVPPAVLLVRQRLQLRPEPSRCLQPLVLSLLQRTLPSSLLLWRNSPQLPFGPALRPMEAQRCLPPGAHRANRAMGHPCATSCTGRFFIRLWIQASKKERGCRSA